ncbi:RagB/SusD family nutrient uptake outer membrane protein [Cytophagaceae bacterium DM2B3-1]|uniref:RagB/SusD family nutrient uptake outer membrane protein n=1 Tax=Xanthocytophaga flava TaxID=3048013 RepID=A0ABT7CTP9_9BACT|nr:RagB/SusD family nutrient uptake outer membrane protein [Xanthocytophaga flavus]MDJ1496327.1 RagB/SusD family nutrient uptake outer membrane protein [Xanthocytophaga flavus]
MKKYILILIGLFILTSCSSYLDVKPNSQIDKDVLFESEEGFMEALVGVYIRCSKEDIYGHELTFGLLDVLAQNYTISSDINSGGYRYLQAAMFNYKDPVFIERKDKLWAGLYNAISNCNLILENIDTRTSVFREESSYKLIKGEALALRAYLHFDLLRMFASTKPEAAGIPYVTKFTNQATPRSTVKEVLEKIVTDLLAAKELLKSSDPIVTEKYIIGYTASYDFNDLPDDGSTEESGALFLQNRRQRMNYYAACGTLARVYLYQNDKANALLQAREVIESGKFPWTKKADFTNDDDEKKDRILFKELLFAWDIPKRGGDLERWFRNENSTLMTGTNEGNIIYETGGVGAEDFRFKQWLQEKSDGRTNSLHVIKYNRDGDRNLHRLVAPALRLSEMYYIAAECVFDTDPAKAWEYFNTVRFNRGIGTKIEGQQSKEIFLSELIKEERKEFFGEGQVFYSYKRLNRNIIGQSGKIFTASDALFVLPLPDDEIAFGQ